MKKKITDLFDDIPIEILDETIKKEEYAEYRQAGAGRQECRFRWTAAAAVVIALTIVGCAGYAAANYDIFNKYFGGKEDKLKHELILEDSYQVQNGSYRMVVESIMADTKVKRILVSVEALDEESWIKMVQKGIMPQLNTDAKRGYSVADCTGMIGETKNAWKKFYLIEAEEEGESCTILCTTEGEFPEGSPEELKKQGYLVLNCPLKLKQDKGICIRTENATFLGNMKLEKVEIHRLSIHLSGTGALSDNAEDGRKRTPEVSVETKNGERICLLVDNREDLPQEAEQYWRSSGRNVSEYSEDGRTAQYELSYTFLKAFDTDLVEKVWVDGVEYMIE